MQVLDAVVIGAGQCGLYAASCLKKQGLDYLVLERETPGAAWRSRLATMKLFTSRQFCGLPDAPMPGDPQGFPMVDEMAEMLENYASEKQLNIQVDTSVVRVVREKALFRVETDQGDSLLTRTLINATGSNQLCIVPEMAQGLSRRVTQCTAQMRNLDAIPAGARVVVVGSGASGRQLAGELASRGAQVTLARGSKRGLPPGRVLGRDLFWWLRRLGILFADRNSVVARMLKKRNPVPCADVNDTALRALGVNLRGRATDCDDTRIRFDCGAVVETDVVVWALGYRDQSQWLQVEGCVSDGEFVHEYGRTPAPGLFIVGRKWLSCRASELVMGVEKDVSAVMTALNRYLKTMS